MIITHNNKEELLQKFAEIRKKEKGRIVHCSGVFDLTHAGHVLFFEDCKKLGDTLVVGVGSDINLKKRKPGRPIINQTMRLKMVDSLKPIDYSFVGGYASPENPLKFLGNIFEALQPDIYVINDDAFNIDERKIFTEKHGVVLKVLSRWCPPEFEEVSTTKLIEKIQKL